MAPPTPAAQSAHPAQPAKPAHSHAPANPHAASRAALILGLGLGGFCGALALRITDPLVAELAREFTADPARVALLTTAFTLPYAAIQPILGPIGESFGKLRMILYCLGLLAVSLLVAGAMNALDWLFVARAIGGIAAGGVMPMALAIIGDRVPFEERQIALSRFLICAITGQVFGGAMAGLLEQLIGWRGVMLACAAFAVAALVAIKRLTRHEPPEIRHPFNLFVAISRYALLLRTRAALLLFCGVFVEALCVYGVFPFIAPMLEARHLGSTAEAGLTVGAFGCGGFLYVAVARRLLRLLGQSRMAMAGGICACIALVLMALAPGWSVFLVAAMLLGAGFYMMHNCIQAWVTEVLPQARASAVALHSGCFFGGSAMSAPFFGALKDLGGANLALAVSAAGILVLGLVFSRR